MRLKQLLIADAFTRCRADSRAALIAYLMAGDPSLAATPLLLAAAVDGGADIIELGFPYSDPIADGPTIQGAAMRGLTSGATFGRVLQTVPLSGLGAPVLAFSYYNPLFVRGLGRSARDLAQAGFAGTIVPDLPIEEAQPLIDAFALEGLSTEFLVTPTTPPRRAAAIAAGCSDFVYIVSRLGVTGTHAGAHAELRDRVARLRALTNKPLAVGFGVSTALQASTLAESVDGIVIGSVLIDRIRAACSVESAIAAVRACCAEFSAACNKKGRVHLAPDTT